ncbi:hypothetical protein ACET3Z_030614 [Daucus carota]
MAEECRTLKHLHNNTQQNMGCAYLDPEKFIVVLVCRMVETLEQCPVPGVFSSIYVESTSNARWSSHLS